MTQPGADGNAQPDFKKEIRQQLAALDKLSPKKRRPRKIKPMASAAEIISKSATLAPLAALTPTHQRLLQAAQAIYQEPGDVDNAAWMAHQLVQATLPHSNPNGNPPEWIRSNGNLTLSIRPGYATNPKTGERYCIGYPYGSIPRLVLFWLITEVVRDRDRRIRDNDRCVVLGRSLSEFMRKVGLNPDNGTGKRSDAKRLRDQMDRLFNAQISFDQVQERGKRWLHMSIAPQGEFWWDLRQPEQGNLWKSWIELGQEFFQAILASPVPVDIRALRELKHSPLALDLYSWATYKTFSVSKKNAPQRMTWRQLQMQLGGEYTNPKDFKRKALAALKKVRIVYPWLRLEQIDGGFIINPSRPSISEKSAPAQSPGR